MDEFIINAAVSLVIGIIGYFLRRTMSRVDKYDSDLEKIKESTVKKESLKESFSEIKGEIKQIREDYTPKETHDKHFDECKSDIKQIKEDYIMKEDFYRELNKVDRKLDYITDMLIQAMKEKGER